jgi:RNA polymerase sigma-70 factor (ECF subfamily)
MSPSDSHVDEALLAATAREPDAFAAFYRRYADTVFAFFMNRTRDRELAADLTAETFAAALAGARRYRGGPNAGPWLFEIARNKLRDSLRRGRVADRARRRLGMPPIELLNEELERVEERLDLEAHEGRLRGLLAALPAAQRETILARVVDERPYEEIARELRCSETVVRKRVSRGLDSLRAGLWEER